MRNRQCVVVALTLLAGDAGAVSRLLAEARTLRASAQSDARERLDELRATVCAIDVVASIDGHDVIHRASVVELIDLRRARLQGANHTE